MSAVIFIAEESGLNLLLNLSRLSNSVTKIVELSATNLRLAEYYNLVNVGRMKGEGLLNAYAVGNSSYGEGLRDSAAVLSDNGTLEELNSLAASLFDSVVNTNGITDVYRGNILLKLLVCKSLNHIHFSVLLNNPGIHAERRSGLPLFSVFYCTLRDIISYFFAFCNSIFAFFYFFCKVLFFNLKNIDKNSRSISTIVFKFSKSTSARHAICNIHAYPTPL